MIRQCQFETAYLPYYYVVLSEALRDYPQLPGWVAPLPPIRVLLYQATV